MNSVDSYMNIPSFSFPVSINYGNFILLVQVFVPNLGCGILCVIIDSASMKIMSSVSFSGIMCTGLHRINQSINFRQFKTIYTVFNLRNVEFNDFL